jgi:glutamate--cysteine ligase
LHGAIAMPSQTSLNDQNICSRIWIQPIKGSREGIEKIGLEMEMHAYDSETLAPIGTNDSKVDMQSLLKRIAEISTPLKIKYDESSSLITDIFFKQGGNISVEPGGQIEYSSAPFERISDLVENVTKGLKILEEASAGELVFLSHGTNPIAAENHPLVLPKERYQIMTRYFESSPHIRGVDMMRHSATVQANLDIFGDENWQDAVNLILVLVPLTSGLFANSRYFKGKKSKFYSERQEIWNQMDPTRSGIPTDMPFADNAECAYAAWAKKANVFYIEGLSAKDQPLYNELTFGNWFHNGYKGTRPNISNWETHLGTLFPHLRLRDFLEIRHIDAQPFEHTLAPIAFFLALAKCKKVRQDVWSLLKEYQVDFKEVFTSNKDYSNLYAPLLDFAAEILDQYKEYEGMRAVKAYKNFIPQKEIYWEASSAHDFVSKKITSTPSVDFLKNLS